MRTENDIRAALCVLAEDAPEASAVLSALPDATSPGGGMRRTGPRGRLARLIAPVAAAIAVIAIAAIAVAIGTGGHPARPYRPGPVASSTEAHDGAVPPYYVYIWAPPSSSSLVTTRFVAAVRDTRTGAVLTIVPPPAGYWFVDAAPGATIDTFLLVASQHSGPSELYLLRFHPSDRATTLTRLPILVPQATDGLAMSPSGTEVAVARDATWTSSELQIYTLSGRLIRQWHGPGTICEASPPCLSWAASGYLAFGWSNNGANLAVTGLRLIPAAAASGNLLDASRLVVPFKTLAYSGFVLSGDGATIATEVQLRPAPGKIYNSYEEFSTATGKLTGRYWQSSTIYAATVYWSSWTGSKLIVTAPFPRTTASTRWPLGILTGGRFTPLPTPTPESYMISMAF
jgi:hypothetical protein